MLNVVDFSIYLTHKQSLYLPPVFPLMYCFCLMSLFAFCFRRAYNQTKKAITHEPPFLLTTAEDDFPIRDFMNKFSTVSACIIYR